MFGPSQSGRKHPPHQQLPRRLREDKHRPSSPATPHRSHEGCYPYPKATTQYVCIIEYNDTILYNT